MTQRDSDRTSEASQKLLRLADHLLETGFDDLAPASDELTSDRPTPADIHRLVAGLAARVRELESQNESLRVGEEAYRNLYDRYVTLYNFAPIGYFTPEGELVACNQRAVELLGRRSPECSSPSLEEAFGAEAAERYRAWMAEVVDSGERRVYEDLVALPDGDRWIRATYTPIRHGDGEVVGIQIIAEDVTDRVEAELALKASEKRHRLLFENASLGIGYYTSDGEVVALNRVAAGYLDGEPEDFAGKTVIELFGAEVGGRYLDRIREAADTEGDGQVYEDPVGLPVGERWFRSTYASITDGSGEVVGVQIISDDITERKRAERELRESHRRLEETLAALEETQEQLVRHERLSAVGQLAAGVAHDFNNILASIMLYSQMSLRAPGLPALLRDRLTTIESEAQRGADLVQQMLDFGRRAMIERHPLDLSSYLGGVTDMLERMLPESIDVNFAAGPGEYSVTADATRIQQAVANLAQNARDAMPEGGALEVRLSRTAPGTRIVCAGCRAEDVGTWVVISVSDTGTGIAPDVLPRIFEPFFTTRAPIGHGLGLAQVYGIVEQHGGHVDVETEVGRGTTFRLYLPALGHEDGARAAPSDESFARGAGEVVLVVEDNQATRTALMEALELLNYRPLGADDGETALELLTVRADEVAVVVCDWTMPVMDGRALAEAMEAQHISTPMLVLSGHPITRIGKSSLPSNVAGWIQKPPELSKLAEAVAVLLREHGKEAHR